MCLQCFLQVCYDVSYKPQDTVSEWLRRWTRNPLASGRRGSNPLGVDLQSLRFLQGFYNVLARILHGFSMLLQGCTRLSISFCKAQSLHKLFAMCVTRFLQGVYKVVYRVFTVCYTGFDRVCGCHKINWNSFPWS